jgi:CrcB protein
LQKTLRAVHWFATNQIVLLSVAGVAGTLARYWLSGFVQRLCGAGFPWGTLAVNVVGCLLFGFFWTLAEERLLISPQTRVIVLIGFMGAFTTFSSYAFETAQLLSGAEWYQALANIAVENVVGIVAVFLGFAIGRFV